MRVLILSQYYDPEPVPKPGELARALQERGHSVSAITGFPNYPSGELYAGFRLRLLTRETHRQIPLVRTFEFPYHGRSVFGRILNYLSFVVSAPLGAFAVSRPDVMYVWHPPLTVGIAAWMVSKILRVPFVYDVQDIWPESALLSGLLKENALVRLMWRLEKFVYRRAAHIVVVTEGARQNLIGKGVAPEKISVMHHWIDESVFLCEGDSAREVMRAKYGWTDDFIVMFAGNLGMVQGLDAVIRAAALLRPTSRVRLVLVGDGTDKNHLQRLTHELGVESRVQFIERQPSHEIARFYAAADALLVHLKRSELSKYVIPTKTLAYLAAGLPIVMAMEGAAADLVSAANAGILTTPEEPRALADTLESVASMGREERKRMGESGRTYLLTHFSKDRVIGEYEQLLAQVPNGR